MRGSLAHQHSNVVPKRLITVSARRKDSAYLTRLHNSYKSPNFLANNGAEDDVIPLDILETWLTHKPGDYMLEDWCPMSDIVITRRRKCLTRRSMDCESRPWQCRCDLSSSSPYCMVSSERSNGNCEMIWSTHRSASVALWCYIVECSLFAQAVHLWVCISLWISILSQLSKFALISRLTFNVHFIPVTNVC